jgi:hypothetical protein
MSLKASSAHNQPTVMTVSELQLSDALRLIYGRRRILDTLYQENSDKFKQLQATDIQGVSLVDDLVCCDLGETTLYIERSKVITNFWNHRTRTPSFFDYKVWSQAMVRSPWQGTPVAGLDYGSSSIRDALEPHLGRPPRIAVDKEGVQKLYFVMEKDEMCSCESWSQLHTHREELADEFKRFTTIQFKPICKHLQWSSANLTLHALRFNARASNDQYNPRICVYHFDHRRGLLLYRITYDGVKTGGQWLPVDGWKEKPVYDNGGMPTGYCWDVFMKALSQEEPFKLSPYSQSVASIMSTTRAR